MPKKSVQPWKAAVKAKRREEAEQRQIKYNALPMSEKLKHAGARQKERLTK